MSDALTFKVEPRHGKGTRKCFRARDTDHTPYNKRSGVNDGVAILIVDDCPRDEEGRGDWLAFSLEEITKRKDGASVSRTITFTLDAKGRAALRKYLGEG